MEYPRVSAFYCPQSCFGKYADDMKSVLSDLESAGVDHCYTELTDQSYDDIRARAEGYDIILIGGGDGTVNRVINATYLLGAEYIILPFGSGNDFSRAWNVSRYDDNIIDIITKGRSDEADLWLLNEDQVFVQSIFLGISIRAIEFKEKLNSRGYTKPIIKALRGYKGEHFMIESPDGSAEGNYLMTSLQNVKTTCNGMLMTEDSDVTDGVMEVEYCTYDNLGRLILNFISTKKGWLCRQRNTKVIKTDKVKVKGDGILTYTVDGEIKRSDKLEVRLSEHKITVRHLVKE